MGVGRAVFVLSDIADWMPYIIGDGISIYLYFRKRSNKK